MRRWLLAVVGLSGACGFQVSASGDASVIGDGGDAPDADASTGGGFVGSRRTYVKASNTDANDQFGSNTAVLSGDGRTLVVGAFRRGQRARWESVRQLHER